jgi:hypothetical protein
MGWRLAGSWPRLTRLTAAVAFLAISWVFAASGEASIAHPIGPTVKLTNTLPDSDFEVVGWTDYHRPVVDRHLLRGGHSFDFDGKHLMGFEVSRTSSGRGWSKTETWSLTFYGGDSHRDLTTGLVLGYYEPAGMHRRHETRCWESTRGSYPC